MKIAVWHNLPSGGGLRALGDQLRGLATRGHQLHVWSPPSACLPEMRGATTSQHVVPLDAPTSTHPSGRAARLRMAWRRRRQDLDAFIDHAQQCAEQIEAIRPDVVLAHPCQTFRIPALAEHLSAPSVLYLQEPNRGLYEATTGLLWEASPPPNRTTPSSVRQVLGELLVVEEARVQVRHETRWVRAFDEVLVNSAFSRESILRAYARDSRMCLLGVDTDRFPLQTRPAHTRGHVLSVGSLVREKNIEFALQAIACAAPHVTKFTWVANVVLSADYRRQIEQLAASLGVPLDLQVAIDHDTLLNCFAEADVFVYAPRLEPFGFAPLEAGSTGLPVVAVAEGGVRETVIDGVNGVVVEPDVGEFGQAVATLLQDVSQARLLGQAGREHVVKRWGLEPSIDRLEARLEAVVRRTTDPVGGARGR